MIIKVSDSSSSRLPNFSRQMLLSASANNTSSLKMAVLPINPSVVKYSIAAKSMDTANIIATEMQVSALIETLNLY